MKKIIKPIVVIFTILLGYICVNSVIIYHYLHEYGYGINELLKTVAVWMRVSDDLQYLKVIMQIFLLVEVILVIIKRCVRKKVIMWNKWEEI